MYCLLDKKIQPKIHKGISKEVRCIAARQSFINYNYKKRSSSTLVKKNVIMIIVSKYCKHMELTIRTFCHCLLFFVRVTIHGSYEFVFLFILFRFPHGALQHGKNSLA